MKNFSTKHTRDTPVPQTYWQHAHVAITKSAKLIVLGAAGIFHGVLPEIKRFQFYTSTGILKAAYFLAMSGRHDREINRIFGPSFLRMVVERRHDQELFGDYVVYPRASDSEWAMDWLERGEKEAS